MSVPQNTDLLISNMLYSCVAQKKRGNEQYTASHSLGYIVAGEIHLETVNGTFTSKEGSIGIVRKNQLIKSVKVPPAEGEFKAINILFPEDLLRKYCAENNVSTSSNYTGEKLKQLAPDPFIKGFFDSLLPYFDNPSHLSASMISIKTNEAIELLLKHDAGLKEFLFDFTEPYKIDLEAFMNRNYMFNVPAAHFAKLTGRSLAGYKRDFEKIFNTSPGQWLQQKRLSAAYQLIKEQRKKPSDVYLDVGFENLSHFSFAFKKAFGVSPSLI